jgi:hypothetical protein
MPTMLRVPRYFKAQALSSGMALLRPQIAEDIAGVAIEPIYWQALVVGRLE